MTCGIYQITSPSGRVYVGQSTNIEQRFAGYLTYSSCNRQKRLYASLKNHGAQSHHYAIIEECKEHELNEKERHWQETLNVLGKRGLNCRYVSLDGRAGTLSSECRVRMSAAQSGKNNPNYGKRGTDNPLYGRQRPAHVRAKIKAFQATRGRLLEQWDQAGNLLRVAKFRDFVADGFNNGNLSSCCSGRLKTTGGYIFKYHETPA